MKPIIVLGMHRSGTSAITRAIGLLGAAMGDKKSLRKHWENLPLRKENERLIGLGNGTWDAPPPPGWWDSPRARKQLDSCRATVRDQFGDQDIAVWKDPRTCLTAPFWLDVFDEPPVYLFIHRHPTEVADSLSSRNHFGRGHGYALWERYNADALTAAQGHPTVVVDYDSLVTEPVSSLARICAAFAGFGVALPKDPATTEHGLVAQERHHTVGAADVVDAAVATTSQQEIFAMLRELTGAHRRLELPRPVPAPHPLSQELFDLVSSRRAAVREAKKSGSGSGGPTSGSAKGERAPAARTTGPVESAAVRRRARKAGRTAAAATAGGAGPETALAVAAARRARRIERRQKLAAAGPDSSAASS